jgi:hypothetical protein
MNATGVGVIDLQEATGAWPLRTLLLWAAFWVAVAAYRGPARDGTRFVAGLLLGAVLAHVGWCLLHLGRVMAEPARLLDPRSGQSLLFVPLGPLVLTGRGPRGARRVAASFRALPFALATARLGCWAAGCCAGRPMAGVGWMSATGAARHPTVLYEIAGWLLLGAWLARRSTRTVVLAFPVGLGLLRLAIEPLRAPVHGLAPWPPVWTIAISWLGVGIALHGLASRRLRPTRVGSRSRAAARARHSAARAAVSAPRDRRLVRARSARP